MLKRIRLVGRYLRDGAKNVGRHLFMTVSSVLTLALTLGLTALFVMFAYNAQLLTYQIEKEIKIFTEIDGSYTPDQIQELIEDVYAIPSVEGVAHSTKDAEYQSYIDRVAQDDVQLAEFLTEVGEEENPMKDVLIVTVTEASKVSEVAVELERLDGLVYVEYGEKSTLTSFVDLTESVREGVVVIVLVLVVLSVFLIQNTIKLTIYARKDELAIMRLIGAPTSYIVWPFLIEGILIGLFGGVVPSVLIYWGYPLIYEKIGGQLVLPLLQLASPYPLIYNLAFAMAMLSLILSVLGSLFAVFRHVRK